MLSIFVQVACFLKFYNSKIFCAGNRVFAVLHSRKPLFGWCRTYWSAPALTFWIKSSLMYPVHVQKNLNKNCPKFEVWSLAHIFFITYTYTSYICWLFTVLNEVFQAKDGNSVYLYKYRRNRILLRRGGGSKARSWQSFGSATLVFIRIPRFILIQNQRWSRILVQVHLFYLVCILHFFVFNAWRLQQLYL